MKTAPHLLLTLQLRAKELPIPEHEYRFSDRRFRFDLCWPELRLAVEVDGGTWSMGRHNRGAGYEKDCEKLNLAVELGWRILRFTSSMVESGEAVRQIERIISAEVMRERA